MRLLLGVLFGLVAMPQPLLWLFLGMTAWAAAGGMIVAIAIGIGLARAGRDATRVAWRTVALLALFSLTLLMLGGEGRFFYANTDWQVRDAVLRDLVLHPWPFGYRVPSAPTILRAPLAMYLLPALAGKAAGLRAAEFAMLAQNVTILTLLLAIGATLFRGTRARLAALAVTTLFSGMDVVGNILVGRPLDGHLEWWAGPQFSAHVTQIFWVPQHAFAGWIGALAYLSWRDGRLRPAGVLAAVPLAALWSPLAAIGLLPFAAHAGLDALWRRRLTIADVAVPAAASLLAVPGLLYMVAGSGAVGGGESRLALPVYLVFEGLEALPFLAAAWAVGRRARFGGVTLAIVTVFLLAAPYGQVGQYVDFVMRASIPSLAILSVIVADILVSPHGPELPVWRAMLMATLAIGTATPLSEARRALLLPPSPAPLCGYYGVVPGGDPTYVAPIAALPSAIRPAAPMLVTPHEPRRCWARPWPMADQFGQR